MWKYSCLCLFLWCFSGLPFSAHSKAFDNIFEQHQAIGTLIIERLSDGSQRVHNSGRSNTRFVPASTFKIPHALFALHQKAVANVDEIIEWDGKVSPIGSWNKSQNMRTAVKNSTVPFFQETARRIGLQSMTKLVDKIGYGNRKIGTKLERFWLDGPLKISAREQIEMLKNLREKSLPFSNAVQVSAIALINRGPLLSGNMYGKTGWSVSVKPSIGWFVGWLETKKDVWFFALNMDMEKRGHKHSRLQIVGQALRHVIGETD